MADKVTYEVARQEVDGWLDYKKVSDKKREEKKASIEKLVESVMDGTLSIDESFCITQILLFPIKDTSGNVAVDKLKYKPRVDTGAIQERTKTVSMTDIDGRLTAIASAVSDTAIGLLKKLDSEDNSVIQSIAVFFM